MKYVFNKKIFMIVILIIISGIIYASITTGAIQFEDNKFIMFKTEKLRCEGSHDPTAECEFRLFNGSILKLKKGEEFTINKFDSKTINIVNYGTWLILILGLFINHLLYNKNFDFKKEIKKINME